MLRPRARVVGLGVAAAAALIAGIVAAPAGPAGASSVGTSGYYTVEPSCAAPTPGHDGCFALHRVRATSRTPGARRLTLGRGRNGVATGPAGGYTPGDLAAAYGVGAGAATTGQTVAIVDAYNDPNARADLIKFDQQYALPTETTTSLRIVGQTGSTTALPVNDGTQPAKDYGWSAEESLDLDAVRGICHTCRIILVETTDSSNANLAAGVNEAVALGATEVSNSYGGPENDPANTAAVDAAYNHNKVVITASTGDDGLFDWDDSNYPSSNSSYSASAGVPGSPASLNSVVAVGGTTLQFNDDGTRASESVWNTNDQDDLVGNGTEAGAGATGGGCSAEFAGQPWQVAVANYSGTTCGTKRLAADVSALADPYTGYDIYDSWDPTASPPATDSCNASSACWSTYGGTSLSSPLISGMWALAGGAHGVNHPSLWLYGHDKSAPGSIYDVTTGGNGWCGGVNPGQCGSYLYYSSQGEADSPNQLGNGVVDCGWTGTTDDLSGGTRECDAATGYDGPSGVGTPRGLTMFQPILPVAKAKITQGRVHKNYFGFVDTGSTDPFPGGKIVRCTWGFGDGTTATGCSTTHTYSKSGSYRVALYLQDGYGVFSGTAHYTIKAS